MIKPPELIQCAADLAQICPDLARDCVPNREVVISQKIAEAFAKAVSSNASCLYCGQVFHLVTREEKEDFTDHILTCDQSPLVDAIKKLTAEVTAANEKLRGEKERADALQRQLDVVTAGQPTE